jgi:hypothetical protein
MSPASIPDTDLSVHSSLRLRRLVISASVFTAESVQEARAVELVAHTGKRKNR